MKDVKRYTASMGGGQEPDGCFVMYEDYAALQQQIEKERGFFVRKSNQLYADKASLAAENAKMLTLLENITDHYEEGTQDDQTVAVIDLDAISKIHAHLDRDVDGDNPFKETDAFLLNVQADGVDKVLERYSFREGSLTSILIGGFAKELRAQAEELQKGGA